MKPLPAWLKSKLDSSTVEDYRKWRESDHGKQQIERINKDWAKVRQEAAAAGMTLEAFVAAQAKASK